MYACRFIRLVLFAALLLSYSCCHKEPYQAQIIGSTSCDTVAQRGYINILDINVLFKEINNRQTRFEHIADFIADNEVDVIFLQEIVKGAAFKTQNSAYDLLLTLRNKHGLEYNLTTAWDYGGEMTGGTGNAILSRCEIEHSEVYQLPFVVKGEKLFGIRKKRTVAAPPLLSATQNVQLANLIIPGRGKMNVYNTHLCAETDNDGRAKQLDELLEYINAKETQLIAGNPSVLGGDFNFDRIINEGSESFMWEKVVADGFMDAYAYYMISSHGESLDTLCEDEDLPDEHCTKGVTRIDKKNGRRVDYIFTKGPENTRAARVVFNEMVNPAEPTVSDHAGVYIRLDLP